MSTTSGVRCPMCGHLSPRPRGRGFVTCACGLRLVNQTPTAKRPLRAQTLFALLAVACMITATADLVRRLH
jgi:hypothetical protein